MVVSPVAAFIRAVAAPLCRGVIAAQTAIASGRTVATAPIDVTAWSAGVEASPPYENPEKREWFEQQVKPHNLDPAKTTLFDWLEG
jgi:hypothetical protein